MQEFDISESRFIVTSLFATKEFLVKSNLNVFKKYNIPTKKYLYFIGNFEPRKNLLTLIKAYRKLPKEIRSTYSLVIAGGAGWNNEDVKAELESAKKAGENVLHIGYIDQADSPALFQNASLFVFPSEYEGFGIPILEALTSGTPVLCSDIPVFHEVGGSAVQYAKASSPKDFAKKINEMLTDPKKRFSKAKAQKVLNKYNQTNTLRELLSTIYD
ncbi:D-inositol-3-phosphate glycosyltransferase [compost metagenome]